MCERLARLNKVKEGFVKINDTNFKNDTADAVVLTLPEIDDLVHIRIKEEIPFIDNEILKKHLPNKFQYELILNEYKELSKYDHTLLSNHLIDENLFVHEILKSTDITVNDLILEGSTTTPSKEEGKETYVIFISEYDETNSSAI